MNANIQNGYTITRFEEASTKRAEGNTHSSTLAKDQERASAFQYELAKGGSANASVGYVLNDWCRCCEAIILCDRMFE